MANVKLITKASEVARSEAWAIVRDDFLGQSKLPEDVVQHFCDSSGCLTVKDVIGEKIREVVDCDQGVLAPELHQIHAQNFYWPCCRNLSFWRSGLLVAVPLAIVALLDNLSDVILKLWPIRSASCTLEC